MGDKQSRIIEIREFYYNDNLKEDKSRLVKTLEYKVKRNSKIKDVKDFVEKKSIESNDPVCACFLEIGKIDENKKNEISLCNYSDSTFLENTVFNDKNKRINVCIKKGRECKCGNYPIIKRISNLNDKEKKEKEIIEKTNQEKIKNQEKLNKMIQEQEEKNQKEFNRLKNSINQKNIENQKNIQSQIEECQKGINELKNIIKAQKEENQETEKQIN